MGDDCIALGLVVLWTLSLGYGQSFLHGKRGVTLVYGQNPPMTLGTRTVSLSVSCEVQIYMTVHVVFVFNDAPTF